jgi:hypothetical protein
MGAMHLDIVEGIEAEFLRDAFRDDLEDPICRGRCIFGGEEEEIAFTRPARNPGTCPG